MELDDFLEHFRLRTTLYHDRTEEYVDYSKHRHVRVWKREALLGRGAFGKVWLEQSRSKRLRAVKSLEKRAQFDHLKEIRAIAKFSKVLKTRAIILGLSC